MKRFITLLIVLASLLSCYRQGAIPKTAELRYGFPSEPVTLDPLSPSNTADGRSILFNVFEGLVKPDTSGRLQPCAAESWAIGEDGLIYDFKLRRGVFFHDGSPLNSADVQFTLETASEAGFPGFTRIEKIEALGDMDLRITLTEADPEFLPYLAIGIVKAGNTEREKNINGTGPFYIESYEIQRSLVLRRFSAYWQLLQNSAPAFTAPGSERVPLEKVTVVFLADSNALLLALQGGSIDGASLTGSLAEQLNHDLFDITPYYSASVQLLALNNAVPPLNDIRVRQAINYSVDIQEIIDTAFYGNGEPSGSPLIPGLEAYYENELRDPYPRDIERARSLLSRAGYGGNNQKKLSMEITVPSNYAMHVDTAQVIAGQLEKAGVSASIRQIDWASWLSDVYRGRKYEATIISLDALNVSPRSFLSRYRSDSDSNFINFHSADFDRVYDASLTETDDEKRAALYREAQRIVSDQAAAVYIQDILGFKVFRGGAFGGVLNYPLYILDFAPLYWTGK
jgi:peptide/nickel transport system substrate-binding protein